MISPELREILCCPECSSPLKECGSELRCEKCNIKIPIVENVPRFQGTSKKDIIKLDGNGIRNPP